MINYWLAKQEPTGPRGYNISTLQKEKTTVWDGVHNNLALKHMRNMKKGDQIIYYHTGDERQAVGVMSVITNPYPNPEEDNDRFVAVNVKFKEKFRKPVSLEQMKKEKSFKNWELLRIARLSVMPVPKSIWDKIIKMSQAK
jgi:predicted RNA-binding protein with PUA-like domain